MKLTLFKIMTVVAALNAANALAAENDMKLWYDKPACLWATEP